MEKLNEHHQDLRNRPPSPPNLGGTGFIALLSVSENHAQSKSLKAFPHND